MYTSTILVDNTNSKFYTGSPVPAAVPGARRAGIAVGKNLIRLIKAVAVLSKHEGMEQKAYRTPACMYIMPGCMGEGH